MYHDLPAGVLSPYIYCTTAIHDIWVSDDTNQLHALLFGRQFAACWSCHFFLIDLAQLCHLSLCDSFSSICLSYHQQFPSSQHVHEVCTESYAVGYMDDYDITVVVQTVSSWAPTTLSMTCIAALTQNLSVYFITSLAFVVSLNRYLQIEIDCFGHVASWSGF
jgi:hypothetical protein